MAYHIAEKQPLRIVGIRIPMVEDMEENQKIVPDFWKSTLRGNQFREICRLPNQEPNGIFGISVYENPKEFYYYIGVATDARGGRQNTKHFLKMPSDEMPESEGERALLFPSGMYEFEIPAATWVIFENDGRFKEDVQSVFRRFYLEWLPFSGYRYAGLPDIEVYPVPDGNELCGHSEVWIAISKEDQ